MNYISAEDRASITTPNPGDRAAPVARHVAEYGALPANVRPFWRDHFVHGYGRVPRDILKSYGLAPACGWGDVLRKIDVKLAPPKLNEAPHGWSEGPSAAASNRPVDDTEGKRRARWRQLAQEVAEGKHAEAPEGEAA